MKKPDRLERKLERESRDGVTLTLSSAIKLLRAEHAWFRRMVQREKVIGRTVDVRDLAYNVACENILHKLTQRRK